MQWAHPRPASRSASRRFALVALATLTLCCSVGTAAAAGFQMFDTPGVGDKPESKLWHQNGSWWCCINNATRLSIYKLSGTTWTKKMDVQQTPVVPFDKGGTCDVLWDGTNLFIATWGTPIVKIYKLSYSAATDNFTVMTGFPVSVGVNFGSETVVLAKDSTGRLWFTYEAMNQIWVDYSISADHRTWSPALSIGTGVAADDISTVVAFGGNKIGVIWSDQTAWRTVMRVHRDTDAPNTWQSSEVIRSGYGTTDDHLNVVADTSGRLFLVVKDYFDTIWVCRRETAGTWTLALGANGLDCGTRPIIQVDEAASKLYLFYTRWTECANIGTNNIEMRASDMEAMHFSMPVVVMSASSQSMNDVQGTKQLLPQGSAAIICQGGTKAYWTGWGSTSGIGGSPPATTFPAAPVSPTNIAGQSVIESPASRWMLCRFDEVSGNLASDASGYINPLTLAAGDHAPHWYSGLTNGGLFFDGDDYASASGGAFTFNGQSYTLEAWVRQDITNTPGTGALFYRADTLRSAFKMSLTSDKLEFGWSTGDTTDASVKATGPFPDGAWHHVAAVWDSVASTARLYIDGQQSASKVMLPPAFELGWNLTVGALVQGTYINDEFQGTIDMAAVSRNVAYTGNFTPRILFPAASTRYLKVTWQPSTSEAGIAGYRLKRSCNGATATPIGGLVTIADWYADMSPTDGILQYEVSAVDGLMQEGLPGFGSTPWESNPPAVPSAPLGLAWTRGLASVDGPAYWEMDEGTGHSLIDGTGFAHNGRFGAAGDGDSAEPTWINAVGGKALRFDGNDDYIEIPDASDLRFQNVSFTIEAWIKRSALGGTQAILVKDASSSTRNYGLMLT